MHLLRVNDHDDFELASYIESPISQHAILSHTWGPDHEEVSFRDLKEGTVKRKAGNRKLTACLGTANMHSHMAVAATSYYRGYYG